jgi:hypothetical protein
VPFKAGLESALAFLNPRFHCCADYQRTDENGESSSVDEAASVPELEILSVASWAFVREIGATEKHRTEVTEATEGGLGRVAKILSVASWAFVREIRCNRKASHRGHRGHRGGFGVGGQILSVASGRLCEKSGATEKHRTEVTEATEGDWGWVTKILSVAAWASGREIKVQGESIAQRPQRGIGVGGQNSIGDSVGARARNKVQGESIAQRSRREIGFGGQRFYQQQGGRLGEN